MPWGVIKLDDGLALICDLESFSRSMEAAVLDQAMNEEAAREA